MKVHQMSGRELDLQALEPTLLPCLPPAPGDGQHGCRRGGPGVGTFTFHFVALEKEMATHSSVLAWRIPRTEEPDGLQSMGSRRVQHD